MVASFLGFGKRDSSRVLRPVRSGQDWLLAEAAGSAISPEAFLQNCEWIERDQAVEILTEHALSKLQRVGSYITVPARRILDKYDFARAGGWVAYGSTIDGERGEVAYFKPSRPRLDFERHKKIKYETPAGLPATPLLPWVSWKQGFKIAQKNGKGQDYAERMRDAGFEVNFKAAKRSRPNGFSDSNRCSSRERCDSMFDYLRASGTDRTFWQWAGDVNLPVLITEGWKKALSLVEHGYAAIALRGVSCWHLKGSPELHEVIAHFATPGRKIGIAFDQDVKSKTIQNVAREIKKLGRALESRGCEILVILWKPELGKGVDDCLVAQGALAQQWLDKTIAEASTFDEWHKRGLKEWRLRVWRHLESLDITPERATTGRYLPQLPELERGAIHIVTSPTGTGKTTQIKKWVESGYFVLGFSPLNSLGKQSAQSWGLPHRHDCGNSQEQQFAFRLLVRNDNGVVCCIESLPRIQELIKANTPLLIVIDECNQVLESLNIGGTLQFRQVEVLELFTNALRIAAANGAIVLSEARVNHRTVEQIKTLSGIEQVRLIEHKAERQSWDVLLYRGNQSGAVKEMLSDLEQGRKLICHVSSKHAGRKLERLSREMGKIVTRIDSDTSQGGGFDEFFRDPDQYLQNLPELPDLLILSPSAKSGISITLPGFDKVYGLFSCHYPSMWMQQLARYRLPVPRRIWCPPFILASNAHEGYCSTRKIQQRLQADLLGYQRVFGIAAALDQEEEMVRIQQAQQEFYAAHATSIGIEKAYPVDILIELLKQEGYNIDPDTIFHQVQADKDIQIWIVEAEQAIWREDAEAIAAADPSDLKPQEAHDLLNSSDPTTAKRWAALKVLYREEFPGIDFNNPEDCYLILTERFGALRRGVLLQVKAANLEQAKVTDAVAVRTNLEGKIQLSHRLPKGYLRAVLIDRLGLLELLDGNPYQESDERVQRIKAAALHWATEIYRFFTLSIKPDQTGVEIVNKLLRKLALKAEVLCKVGGRGRQIKVWGLPELCNPLRVKLLKAATERVCGNPDSILAKMPQSFCNAVALNSPETHPELDLDDWEDYQDDFEVDDFEYLGELDEHD